VHVAMSNTLNTPIEALEREYPLRIVRYALRSGSGGTGRHRGGDGVIRAMRVLEDCRLSLLTERRRHAPRGAAGGGDGALGENRLNGRPIAGKLSRELRAGDLLEIRTPGGGGYGRPPA
jgi:N-methylhydantoinase B